MLPRNGLSRTLLAEKQSRHIANLLRFLRLPVLFLSLRLSPWGLSEVPLEQTTGEEWELSLLDSLDYFY